MQKYLECPFKSTTAAILWKLKHYIKETGLLCLEREKEAQRTALRSGETQDPTHRAQSLHAPTKPQLDHLMLWAAGRSRYLRSRG